MKKHRAPLPVTIPAAGLYILPVKKFPATVTGLFKYSLQMKYANGKNCVIITFNAYKKL